MGCAYLLTTINNAAMTTGIQYLFVSLFSIAGLYDTSVFFLERELGKVFGRYITLYVHGSNSPVFQFLFFFANTWYEMVSYCGFNLHFFNDNYAEYLSLMTTIMSISICATGCLYIFFREICTHILCLFLNLVIFLWLNCRHC